MKASTPPTLLNENMVKKIKTDSLTSAALIVPPADMPVDTLTKDDQPTVNVTDVKEKAARKLARKDAKKIKSESALSEVKDEKSIKTAPEVKKTSKKRSVEETADEEAVIKSNRYILFIGNLAFTTTIAQLQSHFHPCSPSCSVRLMTDKVTKKSKGFAFVEVSDIKEFRSVLAMHHTPIDGRKINVEMTAGGGGGKSEKRKTRLKNKNEKLNEGRLKAKLEAGEAPSDEEDFRPSAHSAKRQKQIDQEKKGKAFSKKTQNSLQKSPHMTGANATSVWK